MTTLLALVAGLWMTSATQVRADEEKEMPTVIPATAADIIQAINKEETNLAKVISDKQLDDVHHHAFAIRDLVNALPDKSPNLTADQLGKLKGEAKFVALLAGRLDEFGDAKNQTATEDSFKKLQGILKQIKSLYPDSAAKSSGMAEMQYTCPMHPEVVQDSPGNCPKCGMKLVVKK